MFDPYRSALRNTPLHLAPFFWPVDWARTERLKRQNPAYRIPLLEAWIDLGEHLRLMGVERATLHCGLQARKDGLLRSGQDGNGRVEEPGVVLCFEHGGQARTLACDAWTSIRGNLRAIGLTLAAMRSLERAGASQLFERAFEGFIGLPPAGRAEEAAPRPAWAATLGVEVDAPAEEIRRAYRRRAHAAHPDKGGSTAAMQALQDAYMQALVARGRAA